MLEDSGKTLWLALVFLTVALIYSSVGQAGASGYLAAMGLFGMAPLSMKTTALTLNLLVAGIASLQFWRLRHLSWRGVYPYALLGLPFSVLGGAIQLASDIYYPIVGMILLLSAAQMYRSARRHDLDRPASPAPPPFLPSLAIGAVIGFVSGTTGTGGGVFLAPIILAMNWATARQTAATTAVYNLMISGAALAGAYAYWDHVPPSIPVWLAAVAIGGATGALLGGRYLSERWMRLVLAALLLASGVKLVFS